MEFVLYSVPQYETCDCFVSLQCTVKVVAIVLHQKYVTAPSIL